jgi:hypothetical protein
MWDLADVYARKLSELEDFFKLMADRQIDCQRW